MTFHLLFALLLIVCLAYDNRRHNDVWRDD